MSVLLIMLLFLLGESTTATGQPARYTFAFRGVPLDQALKTFSRATGTAVAYAPSLAQNHDAYCVAENEPLEAVLRCILQESGLDFYRLSSGTYVLTAPAELSPQLGYLSGLVADRTTGGPVANAHVQLIETDLGTITNRSGRFTFPPLLPGRYVIRVSHVGYHTWRDTLRVAPRGKTHAEAALQAEPIPITPVVVDGIQLRRASEALSRSHIEADDPPIGRAASSYGPFRGINTLPGVRLSDVTADVFVQGGTAGDHQVRLDGVPIHLPRTTLGLIGPFSPFAIDRISVEKAGFSAPVGSQMAGVIRARHALASETRADLQVDPLSVNGRLQVAPSIAGTKDVALMTAARIGLWDIYAPPRLQTTLADWSVLDPFLLRFPSPPAFLAGRSDGLRTAAPVAHFSDLHTAVRLRLDPLRTLHVSAYRGRRRLTGSAWSDPNDLTDHEAGPTPLTVSDDYRWANLLGQVRYDAVLGSHTLLRAQLRGSRYRLLHRHTAVDSLRIRTNTGSPRLGGSTLLPLQDDNALRTVAVEGSVDHAWGPHQLQTGLTLSRSESAFRLNGVYPAAEREQGMRPNYSGLDRRAARSSQHIRHTVAAWRLAGFASDRIALTDHLTTRLGARLTYLPRRATVYAEPRLALRYDRETGPLGAWSMRTAVGLYRQFTHQTDVSVLDAGMLLPSVRVWLPLDPSVAVPRAYHLTHVVLFAPTSQMQLRIEGYLKQYPHRLVMTYAPAGSSSLSSNIERQEQFLAPARGHAYGGSLSAGWRSEHVRLHGQYEYSRAIRRSHALFDGRSHPAPWNPPHRLELGADWMPTSTLTFSLRGRGVWQQPWGLRHVYYDYFGHSEATRSHPPFDLSRPAEHVLPPLYRLDVSFAYARSVGPAALQVRLEVLNATGRSNVADWRLVREGQQWRRVPRYLYPRLPAVALRLSF